MATNIKHDIAQNTKTTDKTKINKYSNYKALRHTSDPGVMNLKLAS